MPNHPHTPAPLAFLAALVALWWRMLQEVWRKPTPTRRASDQRRDE